MSRQELVNAAVVLSNSGVSHCPAVPGEKRPIGAWKDLQEGIIKSDDVDKLYAGAENMGIITGRVSGGDPRRSLEVIDFDDMDVLRKIPEEVRAFMKARTYMEKSPHGVHAIYRYDCDEEKPEGNQKLASPPDPKAKAWIETRGEGGFLIVAPSPGYKTNFGDLSNPGVLTRQERDWLIAECRKFDESTTPMPPSPTIGPFGSSGYSPGPVADTPQEAYNKEAKSRGIASLLQRHGWSLDHDDGANEHWTRPDKASGTSATWNGDAFYVFTSTGSLVPGHGYSAFYVLAHYEHGGDMSAAARSLEARGVGKLTKSIGAMVPWSISPSPVTATATSVPAIPTEEERHEFVGPSWVEVMDVIKGTPLESYVEEVSGSISGLSQEIPLMQSILMAGLCMASNETMSVLSPIDLQGIRMNVYGMSLCRSGAGKGLTSGFMKPLLELLGVKIIRGNSEAAIVNECDRTAGARYGLYHSPELVKLMNASNPVAAGICNCMFEAFNSGEIWWITQPGGKSKRIVVSPAAPSFLVEGQPDVFEKICRDTNMSSGFLARFLFACSAAEMRVRRMTAANSMRVVEEYQSYLHFPRRIIRPPYEMPIDESVYQDMTDPIRAAVDKLSGEYVPKIACMLDVTASQSGTLSIEQMAKAGVICKWFLTRSMRVFGLVHEDLREMKRAKMEKLIISKPGITTRDLYHALKCSKPDFDRDIAPTVLERGDVEFKTELRGGKPFFCWYPKGPKPPEYIPSLVTPKPDPAIVVPPVIVSVPVAANPVVPEETDAEKSDALKAWEDDSDKF